MAVLWGKEYSKEELIRYTGSLSQIAGCMEYEIKDGKAYGVRGIDVKTGAGLNFTILPDRAMDMPFASFKGKSLCHFAKNGIVSSAYYEADEDNWFRSYFAGLLTTCGLSNTGAQCEDEGRKYGLHGRISNTPAEKVRVSESWKGDEYEIELYGEMRESSFYRENILLCRTITTGLGEKKIHIHDVVENQGFEDVPLFLLYHFNIGFPLLSEQSRLILNDSKIGFFDEAAEAGKEDMLCFQRPTHNYFRQVFFHTLKSDPDGNTMCALINEHLEGSTLGIYLKFNRNQLPEFFEFKMMGEGDYQLGLEPSSCMPMGRAVERSKGRIKTIKPWVKHHFEIEIGVIEGADEAQEAVEYIKSLQ